MSLSEELAQLRTGRGSGCRTCYWYQQQPEKVRAEFDACVKDPGVSNAALRRACIKHGLAIGRTQFDSHIRGDCAKP